MCAILGDDIIKRGIFNTFEIEIEDGQQHIFVDIFSMGRYSKLFQTLIEDNKQQQHQNSDQQQQSIPKMIGSLAHWKIVHSACVQRNWTETFKIDVGTKGKFFILLEFLMIPVDLVKIQFNKYNFSLVEILDFSKEFQFQWVRENFNLNCGDGDFGRRVCFSFSFQHAHVNDWDTVRPLFMDTFVAFIDSEINYRRER